MTQTAPNAKLTSTNPCQLGCSLINIRRHVLSKFIKIRVPMNPALTWNPFRSAENMAGSKTAKTLETELMTPCQR